MNFEQEQSIMRQVTIALQAKGLMAQYVHTGGGIFCIEIPVASPERDGQYMIWGTSGETWGGDINEADGNYVESIWSDISCDSEDVNAIAEAIIKASEHAAKLPRDITTVYQYFGVHLGEFPPADDDGLADCELDSVCGKACVAVIDKAKELMALCDPMPEIVNQIRAVALKQVEIIYFG